MPRFSKESKEKLQSCHPTLQEIFNEAIRYFDFKVLCGHRTLEEQRFLRSIGRSRTKNSKHLPFPSKAVDIAPWPVDWNDERRFIYLAGWIMSIAAGKGINLRWGGDWDKDTQVKDNQFNDLGHFELL